MSNFGITFVVLDEAQELKEEELQAIIRDLRHADSTRSCIYVPIVVGTNMNMLRAVCQSSSGGSKPVEVILGPLSSVGVQQATKFICDVQGDCDVLTEVTCFAGGNPRLLVLLLGVCGYVYSETPIPEKNDFFSLDFFPEAVSEFVKSSIKKESNTGDRIIQVLRAAIQMAGAVFRFPELNKKLFHGISSEAAVEMLRALVALSLTQLPIKQDSTALDINFLVNIGLFSVSTAAKQSGCVTLVIPTLVLRHAIIGLKDNLVGVPQDLFTATPFKARTSDQNEIDDVGYILWRLTALRFLHRQDGIVPITDIFPSGDGFGIPSGARGVNVQLPTDEELRRMYLSTQSKQARQQWTALSWANCKFTGCFLYINFDCAKYADSFFQFQIAGEKSPPEHLVAGIQSKRHYSSSSTVDVQKEHQTFEPTRKYRSCVLIIISCSNNVSIPTELADKVGAVQQRDFDDFFGSVIAKDRDLARIAYSLIPKKLSFD